MTAEAIKVLLVEDNSFDARLVEADLKRQWGQHYKVRHARSLSEAVSAIRDTPFDVVLLDLSLADSNGLDTFLQFKAAAAGHLPIIVLSGNDDTRAAVAAVRQGAQDYLIKGKTDSESLARAILFAVERAAHRREQERKASLADTAECVFFSELTGRERDVLYQIAEGKTLKQIAQAFGTSYNTVKNQRASIMEKLNASSDADLVRMVMIARLGQPPS